MSPFFVATYPLAGDLTYICMDFCVNYIKCNSTIYGMMESMKKKEPAYATMSQQDLISLVTVHICEELGVSPNQNKADQCFNGIELESESKKQIAMDPRFACMHVAKAAPEWASTTLPCPRNVQVSQHSALRAVLGFSHCESEHTSKRH